MKACSADAIGLGFAENRSGMVPSESDLAAAASVLNAASRVTILAGAGCEGSHAELMAIAEKLQAPIVHAYRGKEFVEYDNPFDVGMTGLIGWASGYRAMMLAMPCWRLVPTFLIRSFIRKRQRKYYRKEFRAALTGEGAMMRIASLLEARLHRQSGSAFVQLAY